MARKIKRLFERIFGSGRSIFDLSAGGMRYTPPKFEYPSTEQAWSEDWNNIKSDFQRSIGRLERDFA